MTRTVTITLEKRNLTISGEISDADGMFYLGLVFNKEERSLVEEGRHDEAAEKYNARMKKRLSKAKNEEQRKALEQEVDKEMILTVFQLIETNKPVRSQFIWRTLEIFPDFPSHLIYYKDDVKNGLRLDANEIMELTLGIIKEALTDIQEKQEKKPELAPVEKTIDVAAIADQRETRIAQLEAEMAALKSA